MIRRDTIFAAVSLVCNTFVFAAVLWKVAAFFLPGYAGNPDVYRTACFRYFTIDSNIFAALGCLAVIPFNVMTLIGKARDIPLALKLFKYAGASAVGLTFMTVLLFLGPTQGYAFMYTGVNFWLHLVCPLIVIFTFVLTECKGRIGFVFSLIGVVPMLVYGAVYLCEVLMLGPENGGWVDFYGFNMGGLWYVFFPVMASAAYGIGSGVLALHNLFAKLLKR